MLMPFRLLLNSGSNLTETFKREGGDIYTVAKNAYCRVSDLETWPGREELSSRPCRSVS